MLEELLGQGARRSQEPAKALLEWDLERLYRAVDDRQSRTVAQRPGDRGAKDGKRSAQTTDGASSTEAQRNRFDGPRSLRTRILGQRGSRDLVPNEQVDAPRDRGRTGARMA